MHFLKFILSATLCLTSAVGSANVVSSDFSPFVPQVSEQTFMSVHSSSVLDEGAFSLGLFLNAASNSLPRYDEQSNARRLHLSDAVGFADYGLAYGLWKRLEIGFSGQSTIFQDIDRNSDRGQFMRNGISELRMYLKSQVIDFSDGGLALIAGLNTSLTQDNPYRGLSSAGSNGKPSLFSDSVSRSQTLELAFDKRLDKWILGLNAGYRFRTTGIMMEQYPIEPIGSTALLSFALARDLGNGWRLTSETYGSIPIKAKQREINRDNSSFETVLAMRTTHKYGVNYLLGLGTEVNHGISTADLRAIGGITLTLGQIKPTKFVKRSLRKSHVKAAIEIVFDDIQFAFDSPALIKPESYEMLLSVCKRTKGIDLKKIQIDGHTDVIGSSDYNKQLGLDRAVEIGKFLNRECELRNTVIEPRSFGEKKPIMSGSDHKSRQSNRRVVVRLYHR